MNTHSFHGKRGVAFLFSFLFVLILPILARADQNTWIYSGVDTERNSQIVLTMTQDHPDEFTVTGKLYTNGSAGSGETQTFPIKGTYYSKTDELRGTTREGAAYEVDGLPDAAGLVVRVKDPQSGVVLFEARLNAPYQPWEGSTAQQDMASLFQSAGPVHTADVKPTEPNTKEEWNARWVGHGMTVHHINDVATTMQDAFLNVQTTREDTQIHFKEKGAGELVFTLTPSNPNVATYKDVKKEDIPGNLGWAETVDQRTIFISGGRLYLARKITVTSHTQIPNLPASVGIAINSTYLMAEKVK